MAEVTIEIAGRAYRIGCGPGEEGHVRDLAASIDAEARQIEKAAGTVPEGRLLVMSALMLADRLAEAEREKETLQKDLAADPQAEGDVETATMIDELADRLTAAAAAIGTVGRA
ncbi:MAG: cell division protein ZapA [Pseudomonadota bacterium]